MDDQPHTFHPAPEEAPTRPRPRRRITRVLRLSLIVIAGLAVLTGGTLYWLDARHYETTDDAFIDAYTSQIAPRVAGQVTALLFADNQHVTAGQVLLRIDPRDYQARLDQALAQLASAEATRQQAQAQLVAQQANLRQTEANIAVAQADLVQARQDYDRFKTINPAAVTRQQIDTATATFHAAGARLEAAQASRGAAEAQVQSAQAQLAAAEASVKQAQANTETARLQLSYCTILAPVSGIVTHRTVDLGNYVGPGQPLFALVQDGRWVTANFKETQLADMRPGQEVTIDIDAVPAETFHGRVDSFQSGTGSVFSTLPAENATGNYVKIVQRVPVKIVFEDDRVNDYPIAPGMSVIPRVRVR
ncbi:MAG TPA: HlyD family secretion protein [Rhodopila sp.]|nr:HlyD family secretion protein [Rhodopila sp.]